MIPRILITIVVEFDSGWAAPPVLRGGTFAHHFSEYFIRLAEIPVWVILTYSPTPR